jgi:hypothetical protein
MRMAKKVTDELILQRLEDTQVFMRETMCEIKTEMKSMRTEWTCKYDSRMLTCQTCKEELNEKISNSNNRLTAIEIKAGILGSIGGFLGSIVAGLIGWFK